jgi:hypothetical protein
MTIGFGWWHKYAYSDRSLGTVQVVSLDIAWHLRLCSVSHLFGWRGRPIYLFTSPLPLNTNSRYP